MGLVNRLWVLGALCASGCLFGDLDETGKRCDDQRPCSPGYVCDGNGTCFPDVDGGTTTPNLLQNPGFEAGLTGWKGLGQSTLEHTVVHAGANAMRVTVPAGADNLALFPDQSMPVTDGGTTYCLELWARGTPGLQMTLALREKQSDGGFVGTVTDKQTLDGTWQRFHVAGVHATGGFPLDARFFGSATPRPGDSVVADDAWLSASANGTCP